MTPEQIVALIREQAEQWRLASQSTAPAVSPRLLAEFNAMAMGADVLAAKIEGETT